MAFQTDTPEDKPINVPAYSSSGIFGEDVNDVRQQIQMQEQNNALQFANMPRGRGPVYAAALAGQQLGGAAASAAGYVDPRIEKAQKLQDAAKEVDSMGISLLTNPDQYYQASYAALTKRGMYQEAAKVHDIMVQQDIAKAQAETARMKATYGRYDAKKGMGVLDKSNGTIVPGTQGLGATDAIWNMGPPGKSPTDPSIIGVNSADPEAVKAALDKGYIKYAPPGTSASFNLDNKVLYNNKTERFKTLEDTNRQVLGDSTKKSEAAQELLGNLSAYNSMLDAGKFEPGALADFRGTLGKAATFLGYPEAADALRSNPGDYEAAKALNIRIMSDIAARDTSSSRVSARLLDIFKNSVPGVGETYQGNYVTSKVLETAAQHDIARHDAIIKILGQTTTDEHGKVVPMNPAEQAAQISEWDKNNPIKLDPELIGKAKRHAELMEIARSAPEVSKLSVQKPDGTLDWKLTPGKNYKMNGMLVKLTGFVDSKVRTPDGRIVKTQLPNFEVVK